jgi:peptidoglycan-N-acetylglucosamine deacetylase
MNIDATKKLIALTFDDGPDLAITPMVLDKLEEYGAVASFFLIGQNISIDFKMIMERQLRLGCELCNHSWTHPFMDSLSAEEIRKQVEDTNHIIEEMVGVTPKFFRPPYIVTNDLMYENIGLPFISGGSCNDWEEAVTADQRADKFLTTVKEGDIIFMHDLPGNIATVEALDRILPGLLEKGYVFVTVSQLFELKGVNPHVKYKLWTNVGD